MVPDTAEVISIVFGWTVLKLKGSAVVKEDNPKTSIQHILFLVEQDTHLIIKIFCVFEVLNLANT